MVKLSLSQRNERGIYNNLIQELQHKDIVEYKRFLQMTHELFELLSYIEIDITKQTTVLQEPIPAKMIVAATLYFYYLSTGISY